MLQKTISLSFSFTRFLKKMRAPTAWLKSLFHLYPEWDRLPLFYPVFLGLGTAIFFALPIDPPLWIALSLFAASIAFFMATKHIWQMRALTPLIMLCAFGFLNIALKTERAKAPIIEAAMGPVLIEGTIVACDRTQKDVRLIMTDLDIDGLAQEQTPKNIKVYTVPDFKYTIGERVSFKSMLMPPMSPIFESPYKGKIDAYYKQIGGFVFLRGLSTLYKVVTLDIPERTVEEIRTIVSEKIYAFAPNQVGAIMIALVTGKRDKINDETLQAFQRSGLAHILAISGLHVGMFFAVVLFTVRFLLSLFPFIALQISTKKVAACFGLIAAAGYTLLAGSTYPTIRSFLMLLLIFVAMLIDKRVISLRTLAFAAMAILLVFPEAIVSPSFQLSFAAVGGLIAFYEQGQKKLYGLFLEKNSLRTKITLYILGLVVSSVVASLATTPFTLYHFNQVQILGVFSNLIAIPVMGVIVMPFIVLFCLNLLFGFSELALTLVSFGTNIIYQTALYVGSFKWSAAYTAPLTLYGFLLMTIGFLWIILLRKRWRFIGFIIAGISLLPPFFEKLPDIILLKNGKGFVYRAEGNEVYSNLKKGSFAEKFIAQRYNQSVPMLPLSDNPHCDKMLCLLPGVTYVRNKNADIPENAPLLINPYDDAEAFLGPKNLKDINLKITGTKIESNKEEMKRMWD